MVVCGGMVHGRTNGWMDGTGEYTVILHDRKGIKSSGVGIVQHPIAVLLIYLVSSDYKWE